LFWFSSYVTSHCLAAAPQSGAKAKFYCTVYYTTLDSNCEAQRASKNLKKIVEESKKPKLMHKLFEHNIFTFLRRKLCLKVN
jgi:hypothetical protein